MRTYLVDEKRRAWTRQSSLPVEGLVRSPDIDTIASGVDRTCQRMGKGRFSDVTIASGVAKDLFKHFGFTVDNVVARVAALIG